MAGHDSSSVRSGIKAEKAFIPQPRLLFRQLLAANHGRKHHGFFFFFSLVGLFLKEPIPMQLRVCEDKKNEVSVLAFCE